MTNNNDHNSDARNILLLILLCILLYVPGIASFPLCEPEEARCAITTHEMLQSGNWAMPTLCGKNYYNKPAPYYWLTSGMQMLTEHTEFAGRSVSVIFSAFGVALCYKLVRKFERKSVAMLAAMLLATCMEFWIMGRYYRMDMPFAVAIWAAMYYFASREIAAAVDKRAANSCWRGFYFWAAVATLFKGPAGLALPVLVVGAYMLVTRQYRRIMEFFNPLGILIYLLIACPWFVIASVQYPEYFGVFFGRENFGRVTGEGNLGHSWPGILYIPMLFAGSLPWCVYIPGACMRYVPMFWKKIGREKVIVFLMVATLLPLAFFMASHTKLVSYILPVFPPLMAMLGVFIGRWAASSLEDKLMKIGAWTLIEFIVIMAAVIIGFEWKLKWLDWSVAIPAAIIVYAVFRMVRFLRTDRRFRLVHWAVGCVAILQLYMLVHIMPSGLQLLSSEKEAMLLPKTATDVYLYPDENLSFMFYSGHFTAPIVPKRDADALAILAADLKSTRAVWCFVGGKKYLKNLQEAVPDLKIISARSGNFLVTNAAGEAFEKSPKISSPKPGK